MICFGEWEKAKMLFHPLRDITTRLTKLKRKVLKKNLNQLLNGLAFMNKKRTTTRGIANRAFRDKLKVLFFEQATPKQSFDV